MLHLQLKFARGWVGSKQYWLSYGFEVEREEEERETYYKLWFAYTCFHSEIE